MQSASPAAAAASRTEPSQDRAPGVAAAAAPSKAVRRRPISDQRRSALHTIRFYVSDYAHSRRKPLVYRDAEKEYGIALGVIVMARHAGLSKAEVERWIARLRRAQGATVKHGNHREGQAHWRQPA